MKIDSEEGHIIKNGQIVFVVFDEEVLRPDFSLFEARTKATMACLCECWVESNEEIDHHEERKEGTTWIHRLCASFSLRGSFYVTSFVQSSIRYYNGVRSCCTRTSEAIQKQRGAYLRRVASEPNEKRVIS